MECMSFNQLFMIPHILLATTTSTTTNHQLESDGAAAANVAAGSACNQPGTEWEPAINLILAFGMIIMILVSVLSAYMEATHYLKSQQTTSSSSSSSVHHSTANGKTANGRNKPMNLTTSDKKSSNIYAPMFQNLTNVIASPPPPLPAFDLSSPNGRGDEFKKLRGKKAAKRLKKSKKDSQASESNSIAEADTSAQLEQLTVMLNNQPTNSTTTTTVCSSSSSASSSSAASLTTSDKKSSNIYAPMFQNLTNVITSPPPPLPAFDSEEFDLSSPNGRGDEFKKLRGKKAAKRSKKSKKDSQASEINSIAETDTSAQLERLTVMLNHQPTHSTTTTTTTTVCSSSSSASSSSAASLVSSTKSSVSSSSSSTSSTASSASSTAPSSTSSSPPLSASSYGEYSLLGPGVTFELPCLRVRSAKI